MRIYCTLDDLPETWVEFSDRGWTLGYIRSLDAMDGPQLLACLSERATACQLPVVGSDQPITDPKAIAAREDDYDLRVLGFLGGVMHDAARAVRQLGFFTGSPSRPGREPMPPS